MPQFWEIQRAWLMKILNERIYLSRHNHFPEVLQDAIKLKLLIRENGYRSNSKMAGFILRKQREIKILIPSNGAYENQLQFFEMALQQAQNFALHDS